MSGFEMPDFHVITNRYHRDSQTDDHLNYIGTWVIFGLLPGIQIKG
jgi:hypothetical protein